MPRRPAVILLVALLAALLLAPIVLLALAGPAGDAEAPASLMATPTRVPSVSSAQASSTPANGIAFTDAVTPEDAAWYRIGDDPREGPTHIQVGTVVDGVTYEAPMQVDLGVNPERIVPLRPVLGVGDGVVVLVDDDGRDSTMRAVVAATGAIHDLLVSDDVIVNGLLSGDGRMAYYLTADRLTGDVIGAWRLDIESGGAPQPMGTLIGAAPEFRHAAVTRHFTRMLLSPDGSTLALFRCVELDCVLRAVGPMTVASSERCGSQGAATTRSPSPIDSRCFVRSCRTDRTPWVRSSTWLPGQANRCRCPGRNPGPSRRSRGRTARSWPCRPPDSADRPKSRAVQAFRRRSPWSIWPT